jgi:uncharacterized membrane protein
MLWLSAFHIVGLILWMGGLVTLARLLGHHSGLESKEARDALIPFEKKSYLMAILPGFLLTLGTGLVLFVGNGVSYYLDPKGAWGATFHLKLTLVVVLIALDQFVFFKMRKLHGGDEGSRGLFMALHGIIGLLFVVIVVVIKARLLV